MACLCVCEFLRWVYWALWEKVFRCWWVAFFFFLSMIAVWQGRLQHMVIKNVVFLFTLYKLSGWVTMATGKKHSAILFPDLHLGLQLLSSGHYSACVIHLHVHFLIENISSWEYSHIEEMNGLRFLDRSYEWLCELGHISQACCHHMTNVCHD